MDPLQGTITGKDAIKKVTYTHDAMIDLILQNPQMTQDQIGVYFGYTQGWVSRVFGSDAFQARLAHRKTELVNPQILMTLDEKMTGLAHQSLEILSEKLTATKSADMALKTLELSSKAIGMGARAQNVQNNTYVVALPPKGVDEQQWATQAQNDARALVTPRVQGEAVDVTARMAHAQS